MLSRIILAAMSAAAVVVAHPAPAAPAADAPPAPIRLAGNVTIDADTVKLGDLFDGPVPDPGRVVARAPAPGQRYTLSAAWLLDMARNNAMTWRPDGPYDRVVVYRPGQTVLGSEIMAAIKAELETQGMPTNYRLRPAANPAAVTIPATAARKIAIREAYFDPSTREFSAVAEVPPGDPEAQFVNVRGGADVMVTVPVLNRNAARNDLITPAMVRMVELSDAEVGEDTLLDPDTIIGMSPRNFVRASRPLRASDLTKIELVSVPVLRRDMRRGEDIRDNDITWVSIDSNTVSSDAILDAEQLIGKSPRQFQAAGKLMTLNSVQELRRIEVAIAARDVRRGAPISEDDFRWIEMPEADVAGAALQAPFAFDNKTAGKSIRAGQIIRESDIVSPRVIAKGKAVKILYETDAMKLSALGTALEDGGLGDVIRIVNAKSNAQMTAEVVSADQVRVTTLQTAMK